MPCITSLHQLSVRIRVASLTLRPIFAQLQNIPRLDRNSFGSAMSFPGRTIRTWPYMAVPIFAPSTFLSLNHPKTTPPLSELFLAIVPTLYQLLISSEAS
ncbi:hypothetical protein YC2023_122041 [Brassica napus]